MKATHDISKRSTVNVIALRELLEKEYNFEHNQAEGIAVAITNAMSGEDISHLATKADIAEIKQDMSEVKKDIIAIKQDMSEVKKDIIAIKQDIVRLDAKIDGIIDKMTVRFGIMIMGTLGLIKTAQSLGWW